MLLFVGTVCNAMIAPFMGFFKCLAIAINRQFARRIDRGESASVLIGGMFSH